MASSRSVNEPLVLITETKQRFLGIFFLGWSPGVNKYRAPMDGLYNQQNRDMDANEGKSYGVVLALIGTVDEENMRY